MGTKEKSDKFPITVKAGSSAVKIYRDRKPSGDYFRLVFYLGEKRQRLNFHSLEDARTEAAAKAAQLARGDIDAVQLSGRDRLTYGRALDAVRSLGIPLDAAAIEYAQAAKTLAGHSLSDAASFYMLHHGSGISGRLVADAVHDFRQAKITAGRSAVYLRDIAYRLGGFARAFNVEVRDLAAQDVADFLGALKLRPQSFNNHRNVLRTFFGFCQSRGWLSKHVDLLSHVEKRSGAGSQILIFTPEELRKLLAAASPRVATSIAIQAFAGVRTAELYRLTWQDMERRRGYIEITAKQAKTGSRRLIPIVANLEAWLRVAHRNGEHVWPAPASEYYRFQAVAAAKAALPWKANALRHSFISYRVAKTKDIAATALEAGNSPQMIFAHYRELCTEQEAADWFSILPIESAGKIIQLPAACLSRG
jgi:integrase